MKEKTSLRMTTLIVCLAASCLCDSNAARADEPASVSTFHSIGLYWSPDAGTRDKTVLVRYREADVDVWFEGLPLRYNPIPGTDLDLADYRGSLVHLRPGATYEIELSVDDGTEQKTLTASTWPDAFPVARTVQVESGSNPLDITESGTPEGYVLYDGSGAVLDVADQADYNITVDASHVILRGFTLRAAHRHAIRIFGGHDIIIEDSEISGWGHLDFDGDYGQNMDAAVYCSNQEVSKVVVQRCLMHHPRHDSNSWDEFNCHSEDSCSNHPAGPQAIVFYNNAGNHVFRYNKVWSDSDHYYNDIIGGGSNGSFEGFPGPDSDIYGNDLANCWDDGIEAEGGGRNVRVWGNHDTETFLAYANAAVSIGPMYWWRNVSGRCYSPDESQYGTYGPFMKMGYAGSVDWMTGHMYLFHNTVWNADDSGCGGIGGSSRYIKHCVTRNNILHVRSNASRSIAIRDENVDNDFDYDLYSAEVPDGTEDHGIDAVPSYASTGYDPANSTGDFQLSQGTAGYDSAEMLPNFDDYYLGDGPDMGIQETGTQAMRFGTEAGNSPEIITVQLQDARLGENYELTLEAAGERGPILWTLIAGDLPEGIQLSREGTLSGTTQQAGSYAFSVYARNADLLLDRADLTLTVIEATGEPDASLSDGGFFDAGSDGADVQSDSDLTDGGADRDHDNPKESLVGGCACQTGHGHDPEGVMPFLLFTLLLLGPAYRTTRSR